MNNVTKDIIYIGVNDHNIDLFEGQYDVPNGMAYNSYLILDDKIAILDTVGVNFKDEWLNNLEIALNGKELDYLAVLHMEPDHSACIMALLDKYPNALKFLRTGHMEKAGDSIYFTPKGFFVSNYILTSIFE